MLEGSGFEVVDLGIDVPAEKFVEAVKREHADILSMSALLTTTMTYMPEVIRALEDAGIRDQVKVMIGGAPVTQEFCDRIAILNQGAVAITGELDEIKRNYPRNRLVLRSPQAEEIRARFGEACETREHGELLLAETAVLTLQSLC